MGFESDRLELKLHTGQITLFPPASFIIYKVGITAPTSWSEGMNVTYSRPFFLSEWGSAFPP